MKWKAMAALAALSTLSSCVAPVAAVLAGPLGVPIALGGVFGGTKALTDKNARNQMPQATAAAIGQNILPEDVKIYDVHQPVLGGIRWMAETPKGRYSCSSNGDMDHPYCVKR